MAGCRAGAKPHGQADSRGPSAANNRAYANPVSEADCSVPQASRLPVQARCLRYGFALLAAYFKGRPTSCNRAPDFACASSKNRSPLRQLICRWYDSKKF